MVPFVALEYFTYLVLGFTIASTATGLLWAAVSARTARRRNEDVASARVVAVAAGPAERFGVSVVMPAFNEGMLIVGSVRNALAQDYGRFEVVVVNDGSTDDTLEKLDGAFDLEAVSRRAAGPLATTEIIGCYRSRVDERLVVVDKASGGSKASGANAGVNVARYGWVAVRDADELMEPDVLARCMAEVRRSSVPVAAVGTTLLPTNDCAVADDVVVSAAVSTNYWVGCQTIEYLSAFCVFRPATAALDILPFVSGGFGLFRRQCVIDVGGFDLASMGEDLDIALRLHRWHRERGLSYTFLQVPEAVVWTEFPESRANLARQRARWHWGLQEAVQKHGQLLVGRPYGRFGRFGWGAMHVFEWWGAFFEGAGWFLLAVLLVAGLADSSTVVALFVVVQSVALLSLVLTVTLASRVVDQFRSGRDLGLLLAWAVVSLLGYRQLTLCWRLRALTRRHRSWQPLARRGFDGAAMATGSP